MSGRHWSVYGVETCGFNQFKCYIEAQVVVLYVFNKTLEVEQGCVSLVAVIQLCVDAQSTEHHDAADTEQVFLFDAVFPIATIKFVCDWTVEL